MKVVVVIPTHCPPPVILLTVGTLLRTHSRHDLNIHLGMHSNYGDYCQDLSAFEELKKVTHIHLVDEIDWMEHRANVNRYSLMHSKNLENLFSQVRYYDFDYLLVLDNDLLFKGDFVSDILNLCPDSDLMGALFDDIVKDMIKYKRSGDGIELQRMPRMTPWCLLLSRRLYDEVMKDRTVMRPVEIYQESEIERLSLLHGSSMKLPVFADTFSMITHKCQYEWGLNTGVVSVEKMKEWVHHFFSSSFNYGNWSIREKYGPLVAEIEGIYKATFPNGIHS